MFEHVYSILYNYLASYLLLALCKYLRRLSLLTVSSIIYLASYWLIVSLFLVGAWIIKYVRACL
jgi:hypothetical protein